MPDTTPNTTGTPPAARDGLPTVKLRPLLLLKQRQLGLDLETGREAINHSGEKGSASENAWHDCIRDFLPKRYMVSSGFVIDADEHRSEQIDLLVYDQHFCPTVFEQNGKLFVPAESVFAAFEIKQELSVENVRYAAAKLASVRRLRRTSTVIVDRGTPRAPRDPFHILGGLVAYKSSWNPALGEPFRKALADTGDELHRLTSDVPSTMALLKSPTPRTARPSNWTPVTLMRP
jgi:hypothetical protein